MAPSPNRSTEENEQLAFKEQVENYINEYVRVRYNEQQKNWKEVRKMMVNTTKRTLKIVTAVLSIWVPGLVKVISKISTDNADESNQKYDQIVFGKLRDRPGEQQSSGINSSPSSSECPFYTSHESIIMK